MANTDVQHFARQEPSAFHMLTVVPMFQVVVLLGLPAQVVQ